MHQLVTDIFKRFKLAEAKDSHEKKGNVKWKHDKALSRKVLSLEGIVGTSNYIKFPLDKPPPLKERYLYLQCESEAGHTFSLLLTLNLNHKELRLLLNSHTKNPKKLNNQYTIPIEIASNRWSIVVIDLHSLMEDLLNEKVMMLEVTQIELRATLKVKGMFSSNVFYEVGEIPKELALPLLNGQLFYDNYRYYLINKANETKEVAMVVN